MRLLLLLVFTTATLFANAQQTTALVQGEHSSSVLTTCLPMVLLISVIIAGAVYFLSIHNKRGGPNENSNSGKNP